MKLRNNISDTCEFVQTNDLASLAMPVTLTLASIQLVGTLTIPIIAANSFSTLTMNLGSISNPKNLLIGFYSSTLSDANVPLGMPWVGGAGQKINPSPITSLIAPEMHSAIAGSILLVSDDYTKSRRFTVPQQETYWTGSVGAAFPTYGRTYADFGVGALIGYYTISSPYGVFGINKTVSLNAVFLTQNAANTTLNFILFNADQANATLATSVKVAIIR